MSKVVAHATVRVEIELSESAWGDDCNINQVFDQARRGAIERLQSSGIKGIFRIIGQPVVTAVLIPENREA